MIIWCHRLPAHWWLCPVSSDMLGRRRGHSVGAAAADSPDHSCQNTRCTPSLASLGTPLSPLQQWRGEEEVADGSLPPSLLPLLLFCFQTFFLRLDKKKSLCLEPFFVLTLLVPDWIWTGTWTEAGMVPDWIWTGLDLNWYQTGSELVPD